MIIGVGGFSYANGSLTSILSNFDQSNAQFEERNITISEGIRGVPAVIFYKNGVVVDRMVGVRPANEYVQKIDSLK
jgi:thioredoxin-like negative regulator of GroEL